MLTRIVEAVGGVSPILRRVAPFVAAMAALMAGAASADTLTGRAMTDTRMATPPGLTFEAVSEDIARADAPAQAIGRTVIEYPGQPPIDFAIDYDPADLQSGAIPALWATIRRAGVLMFITDTVTRVPTDGATEPVEVRLRAVSRSSGAPGRRPWLAPAGKLYRRVALRRV